MANIYIYIYICFFFFFCLVAYQPQCEHSHVTSLIILVPSEKRNAKEVLFVATAEKDYVQERGDG